MQTVTETSCLIFIAGLTSVAWHSALGRVKLCSTLQNFVSGALLLLWSLYPDAFAPFSPSNRMVRAKSGFLAGSMLASQLQVFWGLLDRTWVQVVGPTGLLDRAWAVCWQPGGNTEHVGYLQLGAVSWQHTGPMGHVGPSLWLQVGSVQVLYGLMDNFPICSFFRLQWTKFLSPSSDHALDANGKIATATLKHHNVLKTFPARGVRPSGR